VPLGSMTYVSGEEGKSDDSSTTADGDEQVLTDAEARAKLVQLLGPREGAYIYLGALGALIGSVLIAMTGTIMIKTSWSFHDESNPEHLKMFIEKWAGLALGFGIIQHVIGTIYRALFSMSGETLVHRLRVSTLKGLLRQEIGYFDDPNNSAGELSEFLEAKIVLAQSPAQEGFRMLVSILSTFIAGIIFSCVFGDWRVLLAFLCTMPISTTCIGYGMSKMGAAWGHEDAPVRGKEDDADMENVEVARSAGAIIGEVMPAMKTVASFNAQAHFIDLYERYTMIEVKRAVVSVPLHALIAAIGQAGYVAGIGGAVWYAGWIIAKDPESLDSTLEGCPYMVFDYASVYIPSVTFSFILTVMPLALNGAIDAHAGLKATTEIFRRCERASNCDFSSNEGLVRPNVDGTIELIDVEFTYPTRPGFPVCRGLNLLVPAGQVCALVGPSGSGKSTVISLLERFYDPDAGDIRLDGLSLCECNLRWLRAQLGLVGQEPILFEGTVAENIGLGKEGATQKAIEEAARMANAHTFITDGTLNAGYETQVGYMGSKLSGGQKQRVAIARAIIRKPAVLLLDEATSALDNESELLVQAALDELMNQYSRTTIMIAHRLSTVRGAGQIAVFDRGKVIESGRHDDLLAQGGLYSELVVSST